MENLMEIQLWKRAVNMWKQNNCFKTGIRLLLFDIA